MVMGNVQVVLRIAELLLISPHLSVRIQFHQKARAEGIAEDSQFALTLSERLILQMRALPTIH